ncbi:MAG TPA: hypothetical protein VMU16_12425 [Candidatus Binataceae bacterium]|nr:hypothetical protein [Candidatus Binataceae bacterium]
MKRTRIAIDLAITVIFSAGIFACAGNQPANNAPMTPAPGVVAPATGMPESFHPKQPATLGGIEAESVMTVHGKIVSVDREKKTVKLEGPEGKTVTLNVDNPYNLESMKAGDRFVAQFKETITIIGKGPSDKPPVASLSGGLWTAKPGSTPGAAAEEVAKMTVIVSAVDPANGRITLRAPDGSTETVHVTEPGALNGVQVGDRIVIILAQSIAIALAPEPGH